MIRQPPILQGSESQQIRQLRSYLYQLSRELDTTLRNLSAGTASVQRSLSGEAESGLQQQMQAGLRDLQGMVSQAAAADAVAETGTAGNWTYVYYKSGRKEAWYNVMHQSVAFTSYGNICRSAGIVIDAPPSPDGEIVVDSIDANGYGASYMTWFAQAMYGSSSYPDQITVRACTATEVTQNVRIRLHVCYR